MCCYSDNIFGSLSFFFCFLFSFPSFCSWQFLTILSIGPRSERDSTRSRRETENSCRQMCYWYTKPKNEEFRVLQKIKIHHIQTSLLGVRACRTASGRHLRNQHLSTFHFRATTMLTAKPSTGQGRTKARRQCIGKFFSTTTRPFFFIWDP